MTQRLCNRGCSGAAGEPAFVGQGIQIAPGVIQSSTSSQQVHRVVEVRVVWGNPDQALAIVRAAIEVLQQDAPDSSDVWVHCSRW